MKNIIIKTPAHGKDENDSRWQRSGQPERGSFTDRRLPLPPRRKDPTMTAARSHPVIGGSGGVQL